MMMNFFLLQLLIATNYGKSFSMFIRAKREENNEEIVDKLFQNKGFFVMCVLLVYCVVP